MPTLHHSAPPPQHQRAHAGQAICRQSSMAATCTPRAIDARTGVPEPSISPGPLREERRPIAHRSASARRTRRAAALGCQSARPPMPWRRSGQGLRRGGSRTTRGSCSARAGGLMNPHVPPDPLMTSALLYAPLRSGARQRLYRSKSRDRWETIRCRWPSAEPSARGSRERRRVAVREDEDRKIGG